MPRQNSAGRPPAATKERETPAPQDAVVVQFPGSARRSARPTPATGEARGQILLFLGVRYERLAS